MNRERIIQNNNIVFTIDEGLGNYKGTPNDRWFHPNGRLGAKLSLYINGKLEYTTNNASTLPDGVNKNYKTLNGNREVPTLVSGVYNLRTRMHLGRSDSKYRAFEVLSENNFDSVPVIRNKTISTSNGINLHYRYLNDSATNVPSFAWSTGCLTVLLEDLTEVINILSQHGIKYYSGQNVGKLIVNRQHISDKLKYYYKHTDGDLFNMFIGDEEMSANEIIKNAELDRYEK